MPHPIRPRWFRNLALLVAAYLAPAVGGAQLVTIDRTLTGCATTVFGPLCANASIRGFQDWGRVSAIGNPYTVQQYALAIDNPAAGPDRLATSYLDLPIYSQDDRFDLAFTMNCCAAPGATLRYTTSFDGDRPQDAGVPMSLFITVYALPDGVRVSCVPSSQSPSCWLPDYPFRLAQLTPPIATIQLFTTPEPQTWALLGTGLLALGGVAARRRRRTA